MSAGVAALDLLPERWRSDRLVRSDGSRWSDGSTPAEVRGDDHALLVVVRRRGEPARLVGRGDPARVRALLDDVVDSSAARGEREPFGWMSVPRGTAPRPDALAALGLAPFSTWEWYATSDVSSTAAAPSVVELGAADDDLVRRCLAVANPRSSADPSGARETTWFGVRSGDDGLLGVIGAERKGGSQDTSFSWHLLGLAVLPEARRQGLGTALTVTAAEAGLERGADWISLGMYADNDDARRIYERLGFVCEARFESYGPRDATHPPA